MLRPTTLAPLALSFLVLLGGCAASGGGVDGEGADEGSEAISETGNDKIAFDFFLAKGLTPVQTAGIIGNLDQESSMNPAILEYGGGPGRGIAQWSAGGRWDTTAGANVVWYAHQMGASPWSLDLQLEFIWWELTNEGYGYARLTSATSVEAAVDAFQDDYEICGACAASNRIAHAYAALQQFGGDAGGSSSSSSTGGGTTPPTSSCSVHDDDRLYCRNTLGAAMYAYATYDSAVVNHLRSSNSWFQCWATGELHPGGNTTWYWTLGDDNASWGWVPAYDLATTRQFDADPSVDGLPNCY